MGLEDGEFLADCTAHPWMPAFAGMTTVVQSSPFAGMTTVVQSSPLAGMTGVVRRSLSVFTRTGFHMYDRGRGRVLTLKKDSGKRGGVYNGGAMPAYPHIESYRSALEELVEYGGSDNEQSIRAAFQNCLSAYCRDHRERLALVPELRAGNNVIPDGTVKDSLRLARGYWEAKDSHDDLDAEIERKFNSGYPRDNIMFEDSQTAALIQNGDEVMRADMSRPGELHRLIRRFLDYELPEIEEFRLAQEQFKSDLPSVINSLREAVELAESENGNDTILIRRL